MYLNFRTLCMYNCVWEIAIRTALGTKLPTSVALVLTQHHKLNYPTPDPRDA